MQAEVREVTYTRDADGYGVVSVELMPVNNTAASLKDLLVEAVENGYRVRIELVEAVEPPC
jgi:hypothetical protein